MVNKSVVSPHIPHSWMVGLETTCAPSAHFYHNFKPTANVRRPLSGGSKVREFSLSHPATHICTAYLLFLYIVANCTRITIESLYHRLGASVSKLTVPYPAVHYPIYALPIAYCFHGFGFNVPWLTLTQFSLFIHIYTNISASEFFVPHFYWICNVFARVKGAGIFRTSSSILRLHQGLIGNGDAFLETLHRFHLQSHQEGYELTNLAGLKWLVLRKATKSLGWNVVFFSPLIFIVWGSSLTLR